MQQEHGWPWLCTAPARPHQQQTPPGWQKFTWHKQHCTDLAQTRLQAGELSNEAGERQRQLQQGTDVSVQ